MVSVQQAGQPAAQIGPYAARSAGSPDTRASGSMRSSLRPRSWVSHLPAAELTAAAAAHFLRPPCISGVTGGSESDPCTLLEAAVETNSGLSSSTCACADLLLR